MKTVYINESALKSKIVQEGILIDSLPVDITDAISTYKTSIGNNPAIPDIWEVPFVYKIVKKRFEETKKNLIEIGEINDVEETDIKGVLSHLLLMCEEKERPYKDELEKLCFNYVVDLFAVPDDTVEITVELKDKIDLDNESILLDPVDGEEIELDDINDGKDIRDEVYKRRILDVLCMGAGMSFSTDIESYAEKINSIDPELCGLYKKILALNDYLMFTKEDIGMTDKNKMQLGTVVLSIGKKDSKVKIESQGVIFPILLSETVRGFMELFVSHGLPSDINRAMAVMRKSDFLKAEPWDMRLGPSLWTLLSDSFNDIETNELPYLLKRIASLSTDKFNFFIKEVFARTKKGKQIMSLLSNKAKKDIEYNRFVDKMDKMKQDKGIITDDYIHPDEL